MKNIQGSAKASKKLTETEAMLVKAGRFAILAVQFNGLLPLSVVQDGLVFKCMSSSFILQCLSTVFFGFIYIYVLSKTVQLGASPKFSSSVDGVIFNWLGILSGTMSLYFRILGLIRKNSTLNFWKRNVELLSEFVGTTSSRVLDNEVAKLRSSIRNSLLILSLAVLTITTLGVPLGYYEDYSTLTLTETRASFVWSEVSFDTLVLLQIGNVIWLCFFIKLYICFLHTIQFKLKELVETCSGYEAVPMLYHSSPSQFLTHSVEYKIRECYSLYLKVDEQVKDFNYHFRKDLVSEALLVFSNLLGSLVAFVVIAIEEFRISDCFFLFVPVVFLKYFYDLGTNGSLLVSAASGVLDQLHHLCKTCRGRLTRQGRQYLQMFLLKVSSQHPTVNAANYFTFNQKLITAVNSHHLKSKSKYINHIFFRSFRQL